MKAMLTITTFDGGDPATGEQRTMTIGTDDPADLARRVSEWAHDVTLRMVGGDEAGLEITDVPIALWEDLTDAA